MHLQVIETLGQHIGVAALPGNCRCGFVPVGRADVGGDTGDEIMGLKPSGRKGPDVSV